MKSKSPDSARLQREWLANPAVNLISGLLVALALIPEAIGFLIVCGLDPKYGLYASFVIAVVISFVGGRAGRPWLLSTKWFCASAIVASKSKLSASTKPAKSFWTSSPFIATKTNRRLLARIRTVSLARICCDKRTDESESKLWRPPDAMTKTSLKLTALLVLSGAVTIAPQIDAKPKSKRTVRGHASYHQHTSRMVTAARVPRGSKLWVWHANKAESSGFAVTVNDSGPYTRGRVLDLSTGAFKRLYGGLNRGVGPVCYRVMK